MVGVIIVVEFMNFFFITTKMVSRISQKYRGNSDLEYRLPDVGRYCRVSLDVGRMGIVDGSGVRRKIII